MAIALALVWAVIPPPAVIHIAAALVGGGVYLVVLVVLRPFSGGNCRSSQASCRRPSAVGCIRKQLQISNVLQRQPINSFGNPTNYYEKPYTTIV